MKTAEYIKDRWMLWLVLIVFIAFKIPHLSYPFFWDESWVYAPAVKEMYKAGPSLMPSAIAVDFSRGHPLLFHFLAASWMKLFGTSDVAMHAYPLFVAVLLLVSVYEIARRLFNKQTAIAALFIISTQVMFFVQSAFVLLEIQLALFGMLAIWFYCRRKYLLTTLFLAAVFFTKESGLILGAILGGDAFIMLFKRNVTARQRWMGFLSVTASFILIGLFFLVQKLQRGWFMYPLHTGLIDVNWQHVYDKIRLVVKLLFRDDYRKYFYVLLCLLSAIAAITQKNLRLTAPLVAAVLVFLVASDRYHWVLPYYLLLPLYAAGIVFVLISLNRTDEKFGAEGYRYLLLSWAFVLGFTAFSAINLYIARYLMIALVMTLFIAAVVFTRLTSGSKWLYAGGLAIILAIQGLAFYKSHDLRDISLGAFDAMEVEQKTVSFLEDQNYYDRNIAINQYLQWVHLLDEQTGFKHMARPFKYVSWGKGYGTELLLFDNIETNPDTSSAYSEVRADTGFRLIYRVTKGKAWSEVYGLKTLSK